MRHAIFGFIFVVLTFYSCFPINEIIIDTETGSKIAGHDKNCVFRIGKTKRSEIPEEQIIQLKSTLSFRFADDSQKGAQQGKIVSVGFAGRYATSSGIKAGDPVQKAIKAYGKPKAMILDYGEDHNVHWILYGLFYENLAFVTDSAFTTIKGGVIGKEFDLSKKYIKKR